MSIYIHVYIYIDMYQIAPADYIGSKANQQTGDQLRCGLAVKRAFWSLLVERDLQTINVSLFCDHKLNKLTHLSNVSNNLTTLSIMLSVDLFNHTHLGATLETTGSRTSVTFEGLLR